jgi:hypothetical protein
MPHSTPSLDITVLKIAAWCVGTALSACAVVAVLMETGALRESRTRYAVVGIAALAFINWLVRLLQEIGRCRVAAGEPAFESNSRSMALEGPR